MTIPSKSNSQNIPAQHFCTETEDQLVVARQSACQPNRKAGADSATTHIFEFGAIARLGEEGHTVIKRVGPNIPMERAAFPKHLQKTR